MLWHVIAPHSDGGYNSIDYRDTIGEALHALRHWHVDGMPALRLARGVNGEPLEFVTYYRLEGERDVPVGAYRTARGARRAMHNVGRAHPDAIEYGFRRVEDW